MADVKRGFRSVMAHSPAWLRKMAVKTRVQESIGHVMPYEEAMECEQNLPFRKKAVAERMRKYPKHTAIMNGRMKELFEENPYYKDISREKKQAITEEMQFYYFAYGFRPHEYVFFDLGGQNKETERHCLLVSDAERTAFRFCANDFSNTVYADKASAYEALMPCFKRDIIRVNGYEDRENFRAFAARHDVFVEKVIRSSRGQGVRKVNLSDYPNADAYFDSAAGEGELLLEELIVQGDEFAKFNPDSVNTVRLSTFYTRHGICAPFGFFRTGRKGSFTDNCATGGVFSEIDSINGVVSSDSCDEFGNRYACHPDTGIPLKGFRLPEWDKAVELCKTAAGKTPDIRYLSWDLAYSDRYGWDIVEVNTSGQFMNQAASLTGMREKLKPVIDDMDLLIPFTLRG